MVGKVHNGVLTDNGKNTFWSRTASCAVRCASIVDAPSFSLPPHRESSLKLGLLISEHSECLQTTEFHLHRKPVLCRQGIVEVVHLTWRVLTMSLPLF